MRCIRLRCCGCKNLIAFHPLGEAEESHASWHDRRPCLLTKGCKHHAMVDGSVRKRDTLNP
jgi:hypothetical protein